MDRYEQFLQAMNAYCNAQKLSEPLERDYSKIRYYAKVTQSRIKQINGLSKEKQEKVLFCVLLLVFDPRSLFTDSRFKYGLVKEVGKALDCPKCGASRSLKNACNSFRKRYSLVRKHAFEVYEAIIHEKQ